MRAMYYSPEGVRYPLLVQIEAYFGHKMLNGEPIPDIEAARKSVKVDENGNAVNVARRENIVESFADSKPESKRARVLEVVKEVDYHQADILVVASSTELQAKGIPNAQEWLGTWADVKSQLARRSFVEATDIVFVGTHNAEAAKGSAMLERLSGLYFRIGAPFNGRPCYQKTLPLQVQV